MAKKTPLKLAPLTRLPYSFSIALLASSSKSTATFRIRLRYPSMRTRWTYWTGSKAATRNIFSVTHDGGKSSWQTTPTMRIQLINRPCSSYLTARTGENLFTIGMKVCCCHLSQELIVLTSSIDTVIGPTPPGTE